jgi:hypothetical protein
MATGGSDLDSGCDHLHSGGSGSAESASASAIEIGTETRSETRIARGAAIASALVNAIVSAIVSAISADMTCACEPGDTSQPMRGAQSTCSQPDKPNEPEASPT